MQLRWTVHSNVVWRVKRISHVCLGVVSFLDGEHPWKFHTEAIFTSSMVFPVPLRNEPCTPASIGRNPRCFQGSLMVFDSGYSWACVIVGDDHIPGMLPACKKLYFVEHPQNHNWWYVLDRILLSCFFVGCELIVCWTLGIRWWINSISCFPMSL
jgi:hypothetical protein